VLTLQLAEAQASLYAAAEEQHALEAQRSDTLQHLQQLSAQVEGATAVCIVCCSVL